MEGFIEQLRAAGLGTFKDEWELTDAVEKARQNILNLRKTITPAQCAQIAGIFTDHHLHSEVRKAAVEILTSIQQYVPAVVGPAIERAVLDPAAPLGLCAAATKYVVLCAANMGEATAPQVTKAFANAAETKAEEALLRLAILGRDILHGAGATVFGGTVLSALGSIVPGRLLQSEDPAILVNALELFDGDNWPAYVPEMDGFLEGCVDTIGKLVSKSKGDDLWGALLAPAALRALGNVVGMHPERLSLVAEKEGLLKIVADMFDEWCVRPNTRNDIAGGCVECVGKLGSSVAGIEALERVSPGVLGALGRIAVAGSAQSTRLMAQHVLGDMLMSSDRAAISRSCETLIFRKFAPSPRGALSALRKAAEQPVEDTSCAALHLIQGLGHHEWGLRALAAQGGMLESLSNTKAIPYGIEPRSASRLREWRHATVRSILLSLPKEKVVEIVGSDMYVKLKSFLILGPQYIEPAVIVSDESF